MDADHSPVRPFAQARVVAGPERDRPVERARIVSELLTDVEVALRRRRASLPHPDPRRPDGVTAAVERGAQVPFVDDDTRPHGVERAEGAAANPAGPPVGPSGDADLRPRGRAVRTQTEHEVDLGL